MMPAMFRYCMWTKQTPICSLNTGINNSTAMTTEMCCMLLCGRRQLNHGTKHIETVFLCVWVYIGSLLHRLICLSLEFSLHHPCPGGAFQGKHSWKLNPYPSDLILFGDVEMAVFNYQCPKPSSVVARFWRNESGQSRVMP